MSDRLTPEEKTMFENFYESRVKGARGKKGYASELEAARDLLNAVVNDGLTPGADGSQSYVRRGRQDWTDPTTAEAVKSVAGGGRARSRSSGSGGGRREALQGIMILLGAAMLAVWYFFWPFGGSGEAESDSEAEAAAVITATVEIDLNLTPTPLPTLESEMLADIVDSSGVKTELVVPRTLEVGGVSFVVQPVTVKAGDWPLPYEERAVSWIYGTVINYVMGVEATPANKELLASLRAGDELILRMSTGSGHRFGYADAVRVAPQAAEVFRQSRPGLTLALLNDNEDEKRVVIRANYIPGSELGPLPPGLEIKAAMGEAVELDGAVEAACLGGRLLSKSGTPPGYIYQAVDYRVKNIGAAELSTGAFKHNIEADGMTYPVVAVPHESNPYPIIPEALGPGQTFTTTAVYAAPETALIEGLSWEYSPGPAGSKMRVSLPPYNGRLAPLVETGAVQLNDGVLMATFVISAGLRGVELGPGDIGLEGGMLSPDGNHFPWRVPPDGAGEFPLLILPGREGQVAVSLLERGFEFTVNGGEMR